MKTPDEEMKVIMEGVKPEIDSVINQLNWQLFLHYIAARLPNNLKTTLPKGHLARRRDIAPSWKAWWNK